MSVADSGMTRALPTVVYTGSNAAGIHWSPRALIENRWRTVPSGVSFANTSAASLASLARLHVVPSKRSSAMSRQ